MLIRTVRMTFKPERLDDFLALFESASPLIRAVDGCLHLELWQDLRYPNVLTTYSHWDGEASLEAYRKSDLFRTTWAETKPLFADRPVVQSHTVRLSVAR